MIRELGCTKDLGQGFSTERICFMPEPRRRFSPQFKAEAVQMVIETGKPIVEVARDLGVNDGTLGNWVNA
jgi:transposase-like protein